MDVSLGIFSKRDPKLLRNNLEPKNEHVQNNCKMHENDLSY